MNGQASEEEREETGAEGFLGTAPGQGSLVSEEQRGDEPAGSKWAEGFGSPDWIWFWRLIGGDSPA